MGQIRRMRIGALRIGLARIVSACSGGPQGVALDLSGKARAVRGGEILTGKFTNPLPFTTQDSSGTKARTGCRLCFHTHGMHTAGPDKLSGPFFVAPQAPNPQSWQRYDTLSLAVPSEHRRRCIFVGKVGRLGWRRSAGPLTGRSAAMTGRPAVLGLVAGLCGLGGYDEKTGRGPRVSDRRGRALRVVRRNGGPAGASGAARRARSER